MLTERDRLELSYLGRATEPLWGGHLKRGEPITTTPTSGSQPSTADTDNYHS
jgi:hypothetical protein